MPAATCAARTVEGTAAPSQSSVEKPGEEIASPEAWSLQADCTRQPSCRGVTSAACSVADSIAQAKRAEKKYRFIGVPTLACANSSRCASRCCIRSEEDT